MPVSYCPVCNERTVHNRVQRADGVGVRERCRKHTNVAEEIDSGECELAN